MAAIRKFLFETDFGETKRPTAPANQDDAKDETPPEPPPPPTFSEEEMASARQQAFAEGRQEGIREAASAVERQTAETLERIAGELPGLHDAQRRAADTLQHDAMAVIQALARKVLPALAERDGLGEIERLAAVMIERLRSEPRIVFRVHPDLKDPLATKLAAVADGNGHRGMLEVVGDADVAAGDCRVEWAQGGAERRAADLLDEMDAIIARNTGEPAGGPETPADDGLDGN